jgi:ABC-2 type transport system ATP-binding protein
VDLTADAGEILGLLGPNGSGKSTTLNMVMGFIRPTSGSVTVNGHDLATAPRAALASVGGLVEGSAFYPYLSGRKNLEMLARMQGLPRARVDEVLALVDMTRPAHRAFGGYSQGMRQRLGVAAALMHRPRLIVLDEPTSGLDPAGTREMRALLPSVASEGVTVVLASHLLTEVEQVCDQVAIMQAGSIIARGTVASLLRREERWRLHVDAAELDAAARTIEALPATRRVERAAGELLVDTSARGSELNRALVAAGIYATEIEAVVPTLESVFMELTEGDTSGDATSARRTAS